MRVKKPSVSQLLDLLNKPALLNWANKIGLEGIKLQDYRKEVATKGTALHNQIEKYLIDKIPFLDKNIQKIFDEFIKDKEIISIEKNIENDLFVGRYDIKLKFNNDIYICDFKSSDGIYLENKLQLIAYRMVDGCDKIAIIQIPTFEMKILDIKDYGPYEDILACLSIIYSNKKLIENETRN
jgi:hypothetical protein